MVQQPEYGNLQDESRSFFLLPSQLDIVFSPFIYLKSYLDGGVGVKWIMANTTVMDLFDAGSVKLWIDGILVLWLGWLVWGLCRRMWKNYLEGWWMQGQELRKVQTLALVPLCAKLSSNMGKKEKKWKERGERLCCVLGNRIIAWWSFIGIMAGWRTEISRVSLIFMPNNYSLQLLCCLLLKSLQVFQLE